MVTLKKEHILKTYPKIIDLVGDSLYVAVSVLTETGKIVFRIFDHVEGFQSNQHC